MRLNSAVVTESFLRNRLLNLEHCSVILRGLFSFDLFQAIDLSFPIWFPHYPDVFMLRSRESNIESSLFDSERALFSTVPTDKFK